MDAFIEVRASGGESQRFTLHREENIVGRSTAADVSVPASPELELEHLLVAPRGRQGCWVSVKHGASTPAYVDGQPFASGLLPWGAKIQIGPLRFHLTNRKTKANQARAAHPGLVLLLVAGVAYVGWSMFAAEQESVASADGIDAPPLFVETLECDARAEPANVGAQAELEADARGDRYLYDPADGVRSVMLFGKAEACFRQARSSDAASRAALGAERMRSRIESDYAARRLQMSLAIQHKQWDDALHQANKLRGLVSHIDSSDAYVQWLVRATRQIEALSSKANTP